MNTTVREPFRRHHSLCYKIGWHDIIMVVSALYWPPLVCTDAKGGAESPHYRVSGLNIVILNFCGVISCFPCAQSTKEAIIRFAFTVHAMILAETS